MQREIERIACVEQRDGVDGALEFARRTVDIYRKAVLQTVRRGNAKAHFASSIQFKRGFIESYLELKRYLHKHDRLLKAA